MCRCGLAWTANQISTLFWGLSFVGLVWFVFFTRYVCAMLTLNRFFEITWVLRAEINPGKAALVTWYFYYYYYFILLILLIFLFFLCVCALILVLILLWKTNLGLSDWSSSPLCA